MTLHHRADGVIATNAWKNNNEFRITTTRTLGVVRRQLG
jgi:hypothetical protein